MWHNPDNLFMNTTLSWGWATVASKLLVVGAPVEFRLAAIRVRLANDVFGTGTTQSENSHSDYKIGGNQR